MAGRSAIAALALGLGCVLTSPSLAAADSTIKVSGSCTLAAAVGYADGALEPGCAGGTATGTTTIDLPPSATPYAVTATLTLTANTILQGTELTPNNGWGSSFPIPSGATISGGGAVRVISVARGATVMIEDLTITGGAAGDPATGCGAAGCPTENGNSGGAIANAGTLTLQYVDVIGSTAGAGPSPETSSSTCTSDCPAAAGASAGGGGDGGGIYNDGTMYVAYSTISHNTAGNGGDGTAGTSASGGATSRGQNGGDGGSGGDGGGIFNDTAGTLELVGSTVSDDQAGNGGNAGAGSAADAIGDAGGNAGQPGSGGAGGGIANAGHLTVAYSTLGADDVSGVGGNAATGGSGDSGAAGSASSPQSGGGGDGGGLAELAEGQIEDAQVLLTIVRDTITGDVASAGGTGSAVGGSGGGIALDGTPENPGPFLLGELTIAGNTAAAGAGGIFSDGNGVQEQNSIVASNLPTNCGANVTATGASMTGGDIVFGDGTCPGTAGDPELLPLADNGGPTETMAVGPGSAASRAAESCTTLPFPQVPSDIYGWDLNQSEYPFLGSDQRLVGLIGTQATNAPCDAGAFQRTIPACCAEAAGPGPILYSDILRWLGPTTAEYFGYVNPLLAGEPATMSVTVGTRTTIVGGLFDEFAHGTVEVVGARTTISIPGSGDWESVAIKFTVPQGTDYEFEIEPANIYGTAYDAVIPLATIEPSATLTRSGVGVGTKCGSSCTGTLSVSSMTATAASAARHSAGLLGTARFSLTHGRLGESVAVALTAAGRRLLREHHDHLKLLVSMQAQYGHHHHVHDRGVVTVR